MVENENHGLVSAIGDLADSAIKEVNLMKSRLGTFGFEPCKDDIEHLQWVKTVATDIVILVFVHARLRGGGVSMAKRAATVRELKKQLGSRNLDALKPDGLDALIDTWVKEGEFIGVVAADA